jgi:hypothetical protein
MGFPRSNGGHAANGSAVHEFFRFDQPWCKHLGLGIGMPDACFANESQAFCSLLRIAPERLGADDRFARRGSGRDNRNVLVLRKRDDDDVDIVALHEFSNSGDDNRNAEAFRECRPRLRRASRDNSHVMPTDTAECSKVEVGYEPGAHDPYSDRSSGP